MRLIIALSFAGLLAGMLVSVAYAGGRLKLHLGDGATLVAARALGRELRNKLGV